MTPWDVVNDHDSDETWRQMCLTAMIVEALREIRDELRAGNATATAAANLPDHLVRRAYEARIRQAPPIPTVDYTGKA